MDTCRFLVEVGANVVICKHSHCARCFETYRGAPIVYGQGNFLFDYPSKEPIWHEGVLVSLVINKDAETEVRFIPYMQSDGQPGVRRPPNETAFLCDFNDRSRSIVDEAFVRDSGYTFAKKRSVIICTCSIIHQGYFAVR